MTKLLEQAIKAVRKLPPERQDELAEGLVMAAASAKERTYTPEQIKAMREGYEQAEAGQFVSDEEVEALFAKFRPST